MKLNLLAAAIALVLAERWLEHRQWLRAQCLAEQALGDRP